MSSEDVAEYVGSIGTAFEPYREVIIENAVNGITILEFLAIENKEELRDILRNGYHIVTVHHMRLMAELSKLKNQLKLVADGEAENVSSTSTSVPAPSSPLLLSLSPLLSLSLNLCLLLLLSMTMMEVVVPRLLTTRRLSILALMSSLMLTMLVLVRQLYFVP